MCFWAGLYAEVDKDMLVNGGQHRAKGGGKTDPYQEQCWWAEALRIW